MSVIGASLGLLAAFALGTWLTSHLIPDASPDFRRWWRRFVAGTQILTACCLLIGTFFVGMSVTWPGFPYNPWGFPVGRKFVAVSLNGGPVISAELSRLPTLKVERKFLFLLRAFGSGGCNTWNAEFVTLPSRRIAWRSFYQTAMACVPGWEHEARYLRALYNATRWRREGGYLILENDTDVLRFLLAPR